MFSHSVIFLTATFFTFCVILLDIRKKMQAYLSIFRDSMYELSNAVSIAEDFGVTKQRLKNMYLLERRILLILGKHFFVFIYKNEIYKDINEFAFLSYSLEKIRKNAPI